MEIINIWMIMVLVILTTATEPGRMRMGIVIQNKRRDAAESFFQKGVRLCTILGLWKCGVWLF